MKLLDIMKAQRKGGKPPTLKARRWKPEEKERISKGLCVACGKEPSQVSSYLCKNCEGQTTMEEIRTEIKQIRTRILGK